MILAAEAVLPLGITAVFASGGNHTTSHAHWGYYMIAAVSVQLFTGWMRTKGLEAKHANFSCIHRVSEGGVPQDKLGEGRGGGCGGLAFQTISVSSGWGRGSVLGVNYMIAVFFLWLFTG